MLVVKFIILYQNEVLILSWCACAHIHDTLVRATLGVTLTICLVDLEVAFNQLGVLRSQGLNLIGAEGGRE